MREIIRIFKARTLSACALMLAILIAGCSSNEPATITKESVKGVAMLTDALSNAKVTLRDSLGARVEGSTSEDGSFSIDTTGLAAPLLVRIEHSGTRLYGLANTIGPVAINPLTDLVVRNWFASNSLSIDTAFESAGTLNAPLQEKLSAIEVSLRGVLGELFKMYGMDARSASLLSMAGALDDPATTSLDALLDTIAITEDPMTGRITLISIDPATGLGSRMIDTVITADMGSTDKTMPTSPLYLSAKGASIDSINLAWLASSDDIGVSGYAIYRDATFVDTTPYPSFVDSIGDDNEHCYSIEAIDGSGNASTTSAPVCARALSAPDTTPPSQPGALVATPVSGTSVKLVWTGSFDDDVTGYKVYRGKTLVASSKTLSYVDANLSPGKRYCYRVHSIDGALNASKASSTCVTTLSAKAMITGTWGRVSISHSSANGWSIESSRITFMDDGIAYEAGAIGNVSYSNTYRYSSISNPDGSITISLRPIDKSAEEQSVRLVLSDDASAFLVDGANSEGYTELGFGVRMDPSGYTKAHLSGSHFTSSYGFVANGPFFSSFGTETFDSKGACAYKRKQNTGGLVSEFEGEGAYSVSPEGILSFNKGMEGSGYVSSDGLLGVTADASGHRASKPMVGIFTSAGDKLYSSKDLEGRWVIAGIGDYGGKEGWSIFGNMHCDSYANCSYVNTVQDRTGMRRRSFDGPLPWKVESGGAFLGLGNAQKGLKGFIGNNANLVVFNWSFEPGLEDQRELVIGIRCSSCTSGAH